MPASTFSALMSDLVRTDAARPLVTFYDHATGERVELSVTTYANWVNKTVGLLQDELDAERGGVLLIDVPTHWLGAIWLGAAWTLGMCVTTDHGALDRSDVVVCGPAGLDRYAGAGCPVVALSLRPLGGRFLDPLPDGVIDYGAVVLAQPDVAVIFDEVSPDDPAFLQGTTTSTQSALLLQARHDVLVGAGEALLTDLNPGSAEGIITLLSPLAHGGRTVWVANPEEDRWLTTYQNERASAQLRLSRPGRTG